MTPAGRSRRRRQSVPAPDEREGGQPARPKLAEWLQEERGRGSAARRGSASRPGALLGAARGRARARPDPVRRRRLRLEAPVGRSASRCARDPCAPTKGPRSRSRWRPTTPRSGGPAGRAATGTRTRRRHFAAVASRSTRPRSRSCLRRLRRRRRPGPAHDRSPPSRGGPARAGRDRGARPVDLDRPAEGDALVGFPRARAGSRTTRSTGWRRASSSGSRRRSCARSPGKSSRTSPSSSSSSASRSWRPASSRAPGLLIYERAPESPFFMSENADTRRAVETLEKTFDPAHFEERWYSAWEKEGRFQPQGPPGSPRFVMVIPPAERDGPAPHRARVRPDDRGHPGPLEEDERPPGPLASGHRPRRHRDPDGGRAASSRSRASTGRTSAARSSSSASGRGGGSPATRSSPSSARSAARSTGRRLRFTLDADLSRAVRHAFVLLYRDGLIYKGRYVVNWCPRCETAVSDLEVVAQEDEGDALPRSATTCPGVPEGRGRRDDAPGDDARRHGAGDPSRRPAQRGAAREDGRSCRSSDREIAGRRGRDPRRPRVRDRGREGDAGPRRQRLRVGAAARPAGRRRHRRGREDDRRGGGVRGPRPLRGAQARDRRAPGGRGTARRRRSPTATTSAPASAATT